MDNFKILSVISKTTNSFFYRALKVDSNELVTIEKISIVFSANLKRKLAEQETLNRLPNKAECLKKVELFRDNKHIYYLLDLIEANLKDVLSTEQPTLKEAKCIMFKLLYSVKCLHDNNLVHGQIVPEHCYSQNSLWKIGDLHHCLQKEYPSKLGYSAPEVILGKETTSSSDIFSLGVLLLELVLDKNIFEGENKETVLAKQVFNLGIPYNWKHFSELKKTIYIPEKYYNKLKLLLKGYSNGILLMAEQMLHWDPEKRASAGFLLQNSFFDQVRQSELAKIKKAGKNKAMLPLTPGKSKLGLLTTPKPCFSKFSPKGNGSIFYTERLTGKNKPSSVKQLPSLFKSKRVPRKVNTFAGKKLEKQISSVKPALRKILTDRNIGQFISKRFQLNIESIEEECDLPEI